MMTKKIFSYSPAQKYHTESSLISDYLNYINQKQYSSHLKLSTTDFVYQDNKFLITNNEEDSKNLLSIMKEIEIADDAFLNSILSYSTYKKNLWTIDKMHYELVDMDMEIKKSIFDPNELYNLKLWHFNKNFFQKINPQKYFMPEQGNYSTEYGFNVNYTYKDGQYSAMDDLAHASVLLSKHSSGNGYVLNVAFRGTEFSRILSYIKSAYFDMTAYYQNFIPFEEAILKFAKNPANQIKEIHVSGHSLGGSMVQEFLNRNPAEKYTPEIHGFTFGSPGAKKRAFIKYLNFGYQLIKNKSIILEKNHPSHDNRLHEFFHSNDPIPKIGLFGYNKNGIAHNLFDKVYQTSQKANTDSQSFLKKMPVLNKIVTMIKENVINKFKGRFHDSKRYILNIQNIIDNYYRLYPYFIQDMNTKTQYWQTYLRMEKKFSAFTIKYKNNFENIIQSQYPEYSKENIRDKLLTFREQIKYDIPDAINLSHTESGTPYPQGFLDIKEQSSNLNLDQIAFNPSIIKNVRSKLRTDSKNLIIKPLTST